MKAYVLLALVSAMAAFGQVVTADSSRGAALFESLHCVQCHSVSGKGGHTGSDLGRLAARNFTPASLAATLWNHAPTMWAAMRASEIHAGDLDEQGAADLFAFFYSARFFEVPGDAARGKLVMDRSCGRCHGLSSSKKPGIPAAIEWKNVDTPFELVASMWNHLPKMQAEAAASRTPLPQLRAQDLVDLLVYVRHVPGFAAEPVFQTSAGTNGESLFTSKGCARCHKSGSELSARIKGNTLTEIAAALWNHGPAMRAAGASATHFEPDEMRDLLSYLWARRFFENSGNAARGAKIFASKGCAGCHLHPAAGTPEIVRGARSFSASAMVSALWRHGPVMFEAMKKQGKPWPQFTGIDMADLITYMNTAAKGK
jgi:mono/diheme cytochrome c family protein